MHVAKRLPVHRGPAAWNAILRPRVASPALSDRVTADVVVVGAGFAGLSAARRLTQLDPTARVVLLEASEVAEAAAGRNSGFMIDLPHTLTSEDYAGNAASGDQVMVGLNRQAIAFAAEAVAEYGITPDYFDRAGKINGAATARGEAANRSYAAHLADLGEPHEMLDAQQMRDVTGSDYYRGGLYTPGTVMLQPAGYVRGLADGLASKVQLHENTPVTGLSRQGADWLIETPQGAVTAGRVIFATNGHLESFGFQKKRLMHVFLFAAMTKELDSAQIAALGGQSRWGITPSDPMGTTMRRIDSGQGGHRIITRTCAAFRPEMESTAADLARASRIMRQKFNDRFPGLSGVQMAHSWAGHLCLARNNVSVTGALDTGLFAACVQNGLGTARGTLTGIAAAEAACGLHSDITAYFASEDQPSRLPAFATLGANAYLRWKERAAGKE